MIALLLLVAAILLCFLNYSEKLWGPIVSIVLGGTVAAIIAVASGLKETRIEQGFATSVVLDHGLAAFLPFDVTAQKLSMRLSSLASLGRPAVQKNSNTVLTVEPASSEDALFQYGNELLQYEVVHELERIQRGGWAVHQTQGASALRFRATALPIATWSAFPGNTAVSRCPREQQSALFTNQHLPRLVLRSESFAWRSPGSS